VLPGRKLSLFAGIRRWVSSLSPVEPREPEPFHLTPAALAHAARVGGVQITTVPADDARVASVVEGGTGDVQVADVDRRRLHGLYLDFDGRWAVKLDLRVDGRSTPNPNSRMYAFDRPIAKGKPAFASRGVAQPGLVGRLLALDGVESVLLRGNAVTVARRSDVPWDDLDRRVDAVVREHLLGCGGVFDGGVADVRSDLAERVQRVLIAEVLPGVHHDGGDIELVGIQDGVAHVHMVGACRSCPASTTTLKLGVEVALKRAFPGEIVAVEAV
jgi:Fe-S cluster biogenesis protein NfuA